MRAGRLPARPKAGVARSPRVNVAVAGRALFWLHSYGAIDANGFAIDH